MHGVAARLLGTDEVAAQGRNPVQGRVLVAAEQFAPAALHADKRLAVGGGAVRRGRHVAGGACSSYAVILLTCRGSPRGKQGAVGDVDALLNVEQGSHA